MRLRIFSILWARIAISTNTSSRLSCGVHKVHLLASLWAFRQTAAVAFRSLSHDFSDRLPGHWGRTTLKRLWGFDIDLCLGLTDLTQISKVCFQVGS